MRVLADGRVRRTRSEWQTILKRFARSGLTVTAFCEREKISPSVFAAWRRKFGETKVKEPRFVELAPPSAAALAGPTESPRLFRRPRYVSPASMAGASWF